MEERTKARSFNKRIEMASIFAPCSLLFCILLLKFAQGSRAREITGGHRNGVHKEAYEMQQHGMDDHIQIFSTSKEDGGHKGVHAIHVPDHQSPRMDHMDPALKVFFMVDDLKIGKTMPIYFPYRDPSTAPRLLPREEADSIPFYLAHLPYLLDFFSFSEHSPQAKAMEDTLRHCELPPIKGETKFCATSLESMLDSARGIFGLDTKFKALTTTQLAESTTLLQNYTILAEPKVISAPKVLACHTLPYPYAVFYCHCQESDNKLFQVSLGGENGEKVEAAAVCHMDTSQWDRHHVSFRVLGIRPGSSPVCHFFPADNLVWVPSSM